MANEKKEYAASTAEGYTWSLNVWRTLNRGVEGYAIEGVADRDEAGRISSFETMHPGSRVVRIPGTGSRLTSKVADATMAALKDKLIAEGYING